VGAYGSPRGLTPALDRLALRGWVFEQATAAVPLTLPSHATILSGLDPPHHGVHNNGSFIFPEDRETLATRLKSEGYSTGAFVAAVVLDRRFGLARGFDVYDDGIERANSGGSVLESERPCLDVVERATEWIRARQGPYFAWVHFYEPHAPHAPPPDLAAAHPGAPYDGEVAAADRCLDRVAGAAELARPGGVITAVTADHGEGLGEHGESTHGFFVYQSTLRVPMVIAGPGVAPGRRTSALTRSADLAPTLLGLLRVRELPSTDGIDLTTGRPAGEAYAESEYASGFGWAPLRALRRGPLKLIEAPRPELYDLERDPAEERNLAEGRQTEARRLGDALQRLSSARVPSAARRMSAEEEEQLRALGYVGSPGARSPEPGSRGRDPKEALPLFQSFERAMALESSGKLDEASSILAALSAREPGNLTFSRSLAGVLVRLDRPEEAVRVLRAARERSPEDPQAAHALALALDEAGQSDDALIIEEKTVQLDPGLVDAFDHLASLQALRGDLVKARESVERALSLDARHPRAWSNKGNIARAQGDGPEAERSYRRALELSPRLPEALNGLGVLEVERGGFDAAAALFSQALERDPGFDEARLNLAVAEAQRGRVDRAVELAKEVARGRQYGLALKARALLRDLGSASR